MIAASSGIDHFRLAMNLLYVLVAEVRSSFIRLPVTNLPKVWRSVTAPPRPTQARFWRNPRQVRLGCFNDGGIDDPGKDRLNLNFTSAL